MVSVVITTCGREPEILRRAMDSVQNQTYNDWEMIVVDDSSSEYPLRDAVKKMVEEFSSVQKTDASHCVRYIAHEVNQGAGIARNTGMAAAIGEYIAYLDDDDEWLPEKLALQVQKAEECGNKVALIYCGALVKTDATNRVVLRKQEYYRGNIFDSLILENYIGSTSFPLIRTECLRKIGGFDASMQSAEDADVWLRLAAHYEMDYVKEPLVCYHIHEGVRISTNISKRIAGMERLNQKNQEYLSLHPQAFCIRNLKLARVYAKGGQLRKALSIWWRAVVRFPWNPIQNGKFLIQIFKEGLRAVRY